MDPASLPNTDAGAAICRAVRSMAEQYVFLDGIAAVSFECSIECKTCNQPRSARGTDDRSVGDRRGESPYPCNAVMNFTVCVKNVFFWRDFFSPSRRSSSGGRISPTGYAGPTFPLHSPRRLFWGRALHCGTETTVPSSCGAAISMRRRSTPSTDRQRRCGAPASIAAAITVCLSAWLRRRR